MLGQPSASVGTWYHDRYRRDVRGWWSVMIAWVLHILELIAGVFGVSIGFSRLPDAVSALQIVTLTAVGLVGLSAFLRHFVFHKSDARRLGWDSTRPEFQYEVGFANLSFAVVAFFVYFGEWGLAPNVAVVLGYGLYLLQAALLHTWKSLSGDGGVRRFLQSALPALVFSSLLIYFAAWGMIAANLSLL